MLEIVDRIGKSGLIGFSQRASCRSVLPFPDVACRLYAILDVNGETIWGYQAVPIDVSGSIVECVEQHLGESPILPFRFSNDSSAPDEDVSTDTFAAARAVRRAVEFIESWLPLVVFAPG